MRSPSHVLFILGFEVFANMIVQEAEVELNALAMDLRRASALHANNWELQGHGILKNDEASASVSGVYVCVCVCMCARLRACACVCKCECARVLLFRSSLRVTEAHAASPRCHATTANPLNAVQGQRLVRVQG